MFVKLFHVAICRENGVNFPATTSGDSGHRPTGTASNSPGSDSERFPSRCGCGRRNTPPGYLSAVWWCLAGWDRREVKGDGDEWEGDTG